jgi:hypothetical protein
MGRLLLLTGVAIIAAGPAHAKPDLALAHPRQAAVCPPGLAKKNPMCMPPGRYRKLFEVGQRVPYDYSGLIGYTQLPPAVRGRYSSALDPRSRYVYDRRYLYRVDPTTMVVVQVVDTLRRP